MATDTENITFLQSALNDAAGKASALWTTFITFVLYLAIAFGSVTDRALFLETPIKLPILGVELPLVAFYVVAPSILLILHFYVFLQLYALAAKAHLYDLLLKECVSSATERQSMRQRLDAFVILQFIAGPREQRAGFTGASLQLIAWITLIGAPVVVLLLAQITFLPYHLEWAVWVQRITIAADLAMAWYFWPRLRAGDEVSRSAPLRLFGLAAGVAATLGTVLLNVCIATFPGELADRFFPTFAFIPLMHADWRGPPAGWASLHTLIVGGTLNEITGRPRSPFSNRLLLMDQSFVDNSSASDGVSVNHPFRGRRLEQAVFDRADLRKADFTGANLDGASMVSTNLQGARLRCASTGAGDNLGCTSLRQANLETANLTGADLSSAVLTGAKLSYAILRNASLDSTHLAGADFTSAKLQGAVFLPDPSNNVDLPDATLWGVTFAFGAEPMLQGRNLVGARLDGIDFDHADLEGVNLSTAQLRGVDFTGAHLEGANLEGANLSGANLSNAELQGASLKGAIVWRTLGTPIVDQTDLEEVSQTAPSKEEMLTQKNIDEIVSAYANAASVTPPDYDTPDNSGAADAVKARLSVLNPATKFSSKDLIAPNFWKLQAPDQQKLATLLANLACNAPDTNIARGLIRNGRFEATGQQIVIISNALKNGKQKPDDCPGASSLSDGDWSDLKALVQRLAGQAP